MVPEADVGTKDRSFVATGLMQDGAMRFPATHGTPPAPVKGAPVTGLVGFESDESNKRGHRTIKFYAEAPEPR